MAKDNTNKLVNVDYDTWKEIKLQCIEKNVTMKKLISDLIKGKK